MKISMLPLTFPEVGGSLPARIVDPSQPLVLWDEFCGLPPYAEGCLTVKAGHHFGVFSSRSAGIRGGGFPLPAQLQG